jgi:hypothetical protein
VKRYDLEGTGWGEEEMVERENGDYCEYDEVNEIIMNMVDEFAETAKEYEAEFVKKDEEIDKDRKRERELLGDKIRLSNNITRLRKALEFYADKNMYVLGTVIIKTRMDVDRGKTAREALAKIEEMEG